MVKLHLEENKEILDRLCLFQIVYMYTQVIYLIQSISNNKHLALTKKF